MVSFKSLLKPLAHWKRISRKSTNRQGRDIVAPVAQYTPRRWEFDWTWEVPDWPAEAPEPSPEASYVRCQLHRMVQDMDWPILYSVDCDKIILRVSPHNVDRVLTVLVANTPEYIEDSFMHQLCFIKSIKRENGGTCGKRFERDLRIHRSPTSLTFRFGKGRPLNWSTDSSSSGQSVLSHATSSLSDSSPSGSSTSSQSVRARTA